MRTAAGVCLLLAGLIMLGVGPFGLMTALGFYLFLKGITLTIKRP